MRYDLVVIGDTAAAREGALVAGRLRKKVAVIEPNAPRAQDLGALATPLAVRTLHEAVRALVGGRADDDRASRGTQRRQFAMRDLKRQVARLVELELDDLHARFVRQGIDRYRGEARFEGPNQLAVGAAAEATRIEADCVLIACGTRSIRPERIPFDGRRVFTSDDLLALDALPRSLLVVGAGTTGIEQASLLAALGVKVTLVDGCRTLLNFCDAGMVENLMFQMRSMGVEFHLGDEVIGVDEAPGDRVAVHLASGRRLVGEGVMYAAGRIGNTDRLNVQAAGLEPDDQGRLWCDANLRTWTRNVYAAGDVVGFPALCDVTEEQGRRAVCHAFGVAMPGMQSPFHGLATLPELRTTGATEQQLEAEGTPFEFGYARVRETLATSRTTDEAAGSLKILFHRMTRRLVGAHAIGSNAAEAVGFVRSLMASETSIDSLADAEDFVEPLPDCLRAAIADALSKRVFEAPHAVPAPMMSSRKLALKIAATTDSP